MAWDDAPPFEKNLKAVLDRFDWSGAAEICDLLVRQIHAEAELFPEDRAKECLSLLRRKRLFRLVTQLAEALLASGQRTPLIRRQYAQALIDQGVLSAAELVLQSILQDSRLDRGEEKEARGLLGRIYKQLYVNAEARPHPAVEHEANARPLRFMQRALSEYLTGYRLDPWNNYWHGINAVALLARAERDGLSIAGVPDYRKLTHDLLDTLFGHAHKASKGDDRGAIRQWLDAWELASVMECLVAIGEFSKAKEYALEYAAHPDADAFEIASTLRQLEEVWQLKESEPPGSLLLPICRAALLQREGGAFRISPKTAAQDLSNIAEAERHGSGAEDSAPSEALDKYREALEACRAVARIETREGEGRGTGLLVQSDDFLPPEFSGGAGGLLLLTNAHVVSPVPFPTALLPSEAVAVFQLNGQSYEVGEVVWSSPPDELDAALLTLKDGVPEAAPLRLAESWSEEVPKRFVLIGHPGDADSRFSLRAGGDDQSFSFQDARPTQAGDNLLRYTTPTPAGSSGSAVFDPSDWSVMALHHSGRGGGAATHANEAALLPAIREAARASLSGGAPGGLEGTSGLGSNTRGGSSLDNISQELLPPGMSIETDMPPVAAPRFYFALEGKGARGRSVLRSADVDLIFDYDVPPVVGVIGEVVKAEELEQVRRTLTPLGVTVAPVGFSFRREGDSGFRLMKFYDDGARSDKLVFELRADEVEPEAGSGFHLIFDVRGSILYQFFLPVRLVSDFSGDEEAELPPLSLDLDRINSHAERAEEDARLMDAAVKEVLSHA